MNEMMKHASIKQNTALLKIYGQLLFSNAEAAVANKMVRCGQKMICKANHLTLDANKRQKELTMHILTEMF